MAMYGNFAFQMRYLNRLVNADPLLLPKDEKAYYKRHPYLRQATIGV